MRPAYPIAYRNEIVETQGRLFGRFQCDDPDADGQDFITAYMRGETRARIDDAAAYPGLHDLDLSLAAERMAGQALH